MKPLDLRLLRQVPAARRYVVFTAATGLGTAALIIAQAVLLSRALAGAVLEGWQFAQVRTAVLLIAGLLVLRVILVWAQERYGHRAANNTVEQLRLRVLDRTQLGGPHFLKPGEAAEVTTLLTRGLENLRPYFTKYVPQLLLAATVTPLTVITILKMDWISALIAVAVLPLIPLFMILVGQLTAQRADAALNTMTQLGAKLLDLLTGLPTLRQFGRASGAWGQVRRYGTAHRRATMRTLRIAFLSSAVLELLTTLCVALIAVEVGMRLVYDRMDLATGLAIIIIAPEVFFPLRQVGTHFHASSDGAAATNQALDLLERTLPASAAVAQAQRAETVPPENVLHQIDLRTAAMRVHNLSVPVPDSTVFAPHRLSFTLEPGTVTALVGPNGSGKSTAVAALLGLVPTTDTDSVALGAGVPLAEVDLEHLWTQVTWVTQRFVPPPGTLAELASGSPEVSSELDAAAALTGFDRVVAEKAHGWQEFLSDGGAGLSLGQRQRLALTRALLAPGQLVILDEPTAHLDALSVAEFAPVLAHLRSAGRTVLVISHDPEPGRWADQVVAVSRSGAEVGHAS